jgi:hypothetical protein
VKIEFHTRKIVRETVKGFIDRNGRDRVENHRAMLASNPKIKDADMALRWDLLFKSGAYQIAQFGPDITDAHIDTMMREVMRDLGVQS